MSRFSRQLIKLVSVMFFWGFAANSCKDDYTSTVPYVYVDFYLNPDNIIELNVPGGSFYIPNQGYGGIIVFRDMIDSPNPYLAFDATCTFEVAPMIRVVSDGSGTATCPDCKSQFILFVGNGSATKGPAGEPLKQYHTYYSGSTIHIKN